MMEHSWATITVNGVRGRVSADTPKRDGIRITPTMREALAIAEAEGAVLAPPRVLDARWEAADFKNGIHTQRLWLGEDDAVAQSEQIDQDVAEFVAANGREPYIVGNACKSWTLRREDDGVCEIYGLYVPAERVEYRGGRYWGDGLPVYHSESDETSAYVVQRSRDSSHNDRHSDYYTGLILWQPLDADSPGKPQDGPFEAEQSTPPRITSPGDRGASVRAWQAYLGVTVDSRHGPITEAATVQWLADRGLARPSSQPPDTEPGRPPEPESDLRPLSSTERAALFGKIRWCPAPSTGDRESIKILDDWAAKNLRLVTIPQLAHISGIRWQGKTVGSGPRNGVVYCHKLIAGQLMALWQAWEDDGLLDRVVTWGGLWCPRLMRGSTTTLSAHAWATAIDINVPWNGLGKTPAPKGERGSVRELVPLAEEHGFCWGGRFKNRPDGMHFEAVEVFE